MLELEELGRDPELDEPEVRVMDEDDNRLVIKPLVDDTILVLLDKELDVP